VAVEILRMCKSWKNLCPPDNTTVRYSTRYTLHPPDKCEAHLVLHDYHLHLEPERIGVEYGNLFYGNKVLSKLLVTYLHPMDHNPS
jgi:hypothetical protein